MGDESGFAEGTPLPYFEGRAHLRCAPTKLQMEIYGRAWTPGFRSGLRELILLDGPQTYDQKYAWWWWCRTPHLAYAYLVRVMNANGGFTYTYANNDIVGIRPMTVMDPDAVLEDGYIV